MKKKTDWRADLKADPFPWLLEEDDPAARLLTHRYLLETPRSSPEYRAVAEAAHQSGPITALLDKMDPEGWWEKPGTGYSPKYSGTVWTLLALAQLGADAAYDPRLITAAMYYLDQAFQPGGQITAGSSAAWTADCLQGNMVASLLRMGINDPRLSAAVDWMARTVTGEGIAPVGDRSTKNRYYAGGKCGPLFVCAANDKQPCAWGAAKVMSALALLPKTLITPAVRTAIDIGAEFLLNADPMAAEWAHPYAAKPSGNWWKLGFPLFYISNLLEVADALVTLGYGKDPRLQSTLAFIRSKQTNTGAWLQEYSYDGKMLVNLGRNKKPNKYVTISALKVLKNVG